MVVEHKFDRKGVVGIEPKRHLLRPRPALILGFSHAGQCAQVIVELGRLVFLQTSVINKAFAHILFQQSIPLRVAMVEGNAFGFSAACAACARQKHNGEQDRDVPAVGARPDKTPRA